MKILNRTIAQLEDAKRWDIDYHLPAEKIKAFDPDIVCRVDQAASTVRVTRDPSLKSDESFKYLDIASIDVNTASIRTPQILLGSEAPSRARKVVQAFDVVVSTVRPTRGAVAVVPEDLHDEICSTGFAVVRANPDVNPFYLHFALRLPSTREQFRKWSTGSSYPAILDGDVAKTLIPLPSRDIQDRFATNILNATYERDAAYMAASFAWRNNERHLIEQLTLGESSATEEPEADEPSLETIWTGEPTIDEIQRVLKILRSGVVDSSVLDDHVGEAI